jgi:hypothetical protein
LSTHKTASPSCIKVLRFFFDNHLTTIQKKCQKFHLKAKKLYPPIDFKIVFFFEGKL